MNRTYEEFYLRSLQDPDGFWGEAAEEIHWERKWNRVLDDSRRPLYRWFTGGILNTCYRWHLLDPVPFRDSLRFTIEHGSSGPNDDRKPLRNHYASVAYYYLDHPEGDGPLLPPLSQRIARELPLPAEKK